MVPLFGTIEVSNESDSDESDSGDDSFGNAKLEGYNTPISCGRKIPRPILDCMKTPDVTPITTEESPEEQRNIYIPRALSRVVDETVPDTVSPRLVALMNTILPPTPRPTSEPRRITTPMLTKPDLTHITPATEIKKKMGPACKTNRKAVVEQKSAPTKKKIEMVDVIDEDGFTMVSKAGKKAKIPSPDDKKSIK